MNRRIKNKKKIYIIDMYYSLVSLIKNIVLSSIKESNLDVHSYDVK